MIHVCWTLAISSLSTTPFNSSGSCSDQRHDLDEQLRVRTGIFHLSADAATAPISSCQARTRRAGFPPWYRQRLRDYQDVCHAQRPGCQRTDCLSLSSFERESATRVFNQPATKSSDPATMACVAICLRVLDNVTLAHSLPRP